MKIENATAKGLIWGKYLRIEVTIAGATPPDGRRVRYFVLSGTGLPGNRRDGLEYYAFLW